MPPGEIIQILQQLLKKQINNCYLILDGIDECGEEDRYKLLRIFQNLFDHNQENLKILVASRYSVDMSRIMSKQRVQEINVVKHIGPDIGKFIEFELQERIQFRRLTVTPKMLEEIGIALTEKADGMYLYVQFQLEDICTAINEDALYACPQTLPRGLPETYDRILSKIEHFQDLHMARHVFNWVLAASKPLTVEELAEACAFKFGDKQYSDGARRLATNNWKLIFNCNNLVTVDRHDGKDSVRFAHATVLEHLRRKGIVDDDTAYQNAACICLTYLNLTDFERQITRYSPSHSENTCIQSPKELIPILISPSQNLPPTALAVEKVSRIRNFRKLKASTLTLPPIDLKNLQIKFSISRTSRELQILERKYKFAKYARQNWIEHCRILSETNSCWSLFSKMVDKLFQKALPCPWAGDILALGLGVDIKFQGSIISPSERVSVVWAVRYQHVPLLQLLQARMDPTKWSLILRLPVRDGKLINAINGADWDSYFTFAINPDFSTWEAFRNTSSEEKDLGPMRDSLIVDSILRSETRPHYMTGGSGDVTRRSPPTISDGTNWFLIRSCPSLGLSLIIYLQDKVRFSIFFQKSTDLDLQGILFQHGPYLVDPIGLVLVTLSKGQHRRYGISMVEIILGST
ncbi:hypothetical protein TWF225_009053 [Orbilia oligospora]|uniref:NACHT domain-containing protein n=1 Tax=Orbilia oligospora TaxID=2813651 RepID=A0A7C8KR69_ORBOL|nr:hypothetical protein TWF751_006191 [Orbilia oligospora]KAF3175162.1 hypothetical protein TWF225_009053 [Orbilia oligospora]KAF3241719.1 hypothetical protein TWF128_010716 [Orbilia oligospora]KAF3249779.1 hypothetical protein TWF217_008692 [Orbilia oligospora]KAF3292569.1 hypothetical protein TWF132_005619 [Orbilia oligospora]